MWEKFTLFSIANRVPFMISIPGLTDRGFHTEKLVELVDLFPTLVEAAGFKPLEPCPKNSRNIKLCSEGSSLMPLIKDPKITKWKDAVFWQFPRGNKHKYLNNIPRKMGYAIRTEEYRYTEYVWIKFPEPGNYLNYAPDWENPCDHEELYDLKLDPQETINR